MARKFKELADALDAKLTPEQRAADKAWVEQEMAAIRSSRDLTQRAMAEALGMDQGSVSRLEKQKDMRVSTLRSYVEAMGARLEIRAVFPDARPAMKIGD